MLRTIFFTAGFQAYNIVLTHIRLSGPRAPRACRRRPPGGGDTASCLYPPPRILGGLARCSGSQGCMPSTCSACFGKQCHGYTVAGLGLSSGSIPARRVTEIRWVYLLWPELGFVVSTTLALGPVPPTHLPSLCLSTNPTLLPLHSPVMQHHSSWAVTFHRSLGMLISSISYPCLIANGSLSRSREIPSAQFDLLSTNSNHT